MSKCKLCGGKLETDKEKDRGVCHECMHRGFWKLSEVIGKMRKEHGDLGND